MSSMGAARDRNTRLMWGLQLSGQSGRFATGVILIAMGAVMLLGQQGVLPHGFWRHGWPWIIVIISVVQIVTARTVDRLGDGVFFGLIGVWLVLVQSRWQGLTYSNSWPLTLVAAGAGHVIKALAGAFLPGAPGVRAGRMDDRDPQEGGGNA